MAMVSTRISLARVSEAGREVKKFMPRDDYPTCRRTYATLRVYHKTAAPSVVSRALKLKPTNTQMVGKQWIRRGRKTIYPISGWFLDSESSVESYDSAQHLRWLVAL